MSQLISIIIPSYNAELTILETLDSVCEQTWEQLEVIVVDDGSADTTADLVDAYADPRVRIIRETNGGACRARNIGIKQAVGQYLLFLDSDDLLNPEHIALKVDTLNKLNDPMAVAYGPWWEFITDPVIGGPVGFNQGRDFAQPMDWLFASMEESFYLPPHCWLVSATVVSAAGEWLEELMQNQDGEYFSRILQVASQVIWVPGAVAFYRGGDTSSLSSVKGSEYTQSLITAANLIRDRMLASTVVDESNQRMISALYLRILYRMDVSDVDLKKQIWGLIDELGLPPRRIPLGGSLFMFLRSIFGWKLAFEIKHRLRP